MIIKIGQKVKGFRFTTDSGVMYLTNMDEYIGEEGTITYISKEKVIWGCFTFDITFSDGETYTYPIDLYIEEVVRERESKLKELGI